MRHKKGVFKKKLKDGQAIVAKGKLKKITGASHVFWSLVTDKGACEIMITDDVEWGEKAANCGDGASVTIIGGIQIEFGLPGVKPDLISCN